MITFNNLSSILVPLVGLVFPAIAMASLFLHVKKKKKDFLDIDMIRPNLIYFFFQDLDHNIDIDFLE
ncbi:hypothetical protein I3760_14G030000 [Carya illinoinensis]|nr:hypothetical protein I3760_14G030000 [Carya illinoinensis]